MSRYLFVTCLLAVFLTTFAGCGKKVDPTMPTAPSKTRTMTRPDGGK